MALLLTACASTGDIKSYSSLKETKVFSEEETRVWSSAVELDKALMNKDLIYADPELETYLNETVHKLYPELADAIHVKPIRASTLNAFALANGSIYIHIGLIARMDNEAQLATVIGHEAVHFINKHNLKQMRNVKNSAAWGTGLGIAVGPLIGALAAVSNISGYSKELEREADNESYKRLIISGYDTAEAVKVFQILMAEVKALDIDEPYFFASHPKLKLRVNSFNKLNKNNTVKGDILNRERFLKITGKARIDSLKEDLASSRYKSVLLALDSSEKLSKYPEYIHYYLGEAYRLRNNDQDIAKAEEAYLEALKRSPEFAPSYKSLGVLSMKNHKNDDSLHYFKKYLSLAPEASDRGYVENYIESIVKERSGS